MASGMTFIQYVHDSDPLVLKLSDWNLRGSQAEHRLTHWAQSLSCPEMHCRVLSMQPCMCMITQRAV